MSIWHSFNRPIFVLAPMEDVTDTVFRRVVIRLGAPDIFFTEFTNVEGLCSSGRLRVAHRLLHTPEETPLVAQIWGSDPQNYYTVAQELAEAGFAGIDINMGCPDRKVVRRGQCSGLINQPQLAAEIIAATKEGAGSLPVSVKTRCGIDDWRTESWISFLLQQDIAALTLHGRIAREMSKFPADWQQIGLAAKLGRDIAPQTKIIGNGDVSSYQDGINKTNEHGLDGVMVGRGIFANPWIFNPKVDRSAVPLAERLHLIRYHVTLFKTDWVDHATANGKHKNYNLLKKFFKIYLHDLPQSDQLRAKLMDTQSPDQCLKVLDEVGR